MKLIYLFIFAHSRTFPLDWKTPIGYVVAWFWQSTASCSIHVALVPVLTLIAASSWFFATIADEMTQELAAFNNDVKASKGKDDDAEIERRFCDIIQLYSDAKE